MNTNIIYYMYRSPINNVDKFILKTCFCVFMFKKKYLAISSGMNGVPSILLNDCVNEIITPLTIVLTSHSKKE